MALAKIELLVGRGFKKIIDYRRSHCLWMRVIRIPGEVTVEWQMKRTAALAEGKKGRFFNIS